MEKNVKYSFTASIYVLNMYYYVRRAGNRYVATENRRNRLKLFVHIIQ